MKYWLTILLFIMAAYQVSAANFGVAPLPNSISPTQHSATKAHHRAKTKGVKHLFRHKRNKQPLRLQNAPTEQATDRAFVWQLIAFISASLAAISLIVIGIVLDLAWVWVLGTVFAFILLALVILLIYMFSNWHLF